MPDKSTSNDMISAEIGKKIRSFRKRQGLTLEQLAPIVCKSKSTLSKYEKGEISIDIETLYDLADAFGIHVEQLLWLRPERAPISKASAKPAFFDGISRFYGYLYDGRIHSVLRCVFDVLSQTDEGRYKVMMCMNFEDYDHYQECETTYIGYIEHYDAVTNVILTNNDSPMERASVQALASYLDRDRQWAMWNGLSSRPVMPVATKMLLSKTILKETDELISSLKISEEDINLFRLYNMFPVI